MIASLAWLRRSGLLMLLALWACLCSVAADLPADTVRLHFHRPNADYTGWGLHLWGDGLRGSAAAVSWTAPMQPAGSDDYGVYFDVAIKPGLKTFGFVLHRGEAKNVTMDQYWFSTSHGREVWLLDGSETLFTSRPTVSPPPPASLNAPGQPLPVWLWFALVSAAGVGLIWWRLQRRTVAAERKLQAQMILLTEARAELSQQMDAFRQNEQRLRQLSGSDDLTGLATRAGLQQALGRVQSRARRQAGKVALLFIDLDNFKPINDSEGHDAGDAVLKAIASRFTAALRESDVVARIGGDEFVVLAEDAGEERAVAAVARKLIAAATTPVAFGTRMLQVGASVGIAIYPDDSADASTLIKLADSAMYAAKHAGKQQFRFHAEAANQLCAREMALDRQMPEALARGELAIQLMPIQQLSDGRTMACEALLRWRQPDDACLAAREFIHIAEGNGQILAMGAWMLNQACLLASRWPDERAISVNLSALELEQPRLLSLVDQALQHSGLTPQRLILEIPAAALGPHGALASNLDGLQTLGVGLALDKIDPQQLALATLASRRWHWLKLSAQGLAGGDAEQHRLLWRGLLAAARSHGSRVIATRIDSLLLKTELAGLGCEFGEGYAIDAGSLAPAPSLV